MEKVAELGKKPQLDIRDACFILQFLQDQTGPLLSLRTQATLSSSHAKLSTNGVPDVARASAATQSYPGNLVESRKKQSLKNVQGGIKKNPELNIASLDEFPPVTAVAHEKR